jgi:putative endonuclease
MTIKPNGVLYIGLTDDLQERVKEHKLKKYPNAFTAKYNCDKLVYFEKINSSIEAEKRELQIKKWKRDWKIRIIEELNPNWTDISLNWKFDLNKFRE